MSMKTKSTSLCSGFFIAIFLFVCNTLYAQLKADFTSNVQSGCLPLIVAFQDKSTGNPTSWTWNLGNGTIAANQNPVTTYADPGTYTIKLSIKNASGKDSVIRTSYITVYALPQVGFDAASTQGCYPLDVKYSNNSKAGSGTISFYLWDFGDGNIDTIAKPMHTYVSGGVFDITLKVTNSYGCYSALTKSDFIKIDNGVNAGFDLVSLDVCKSPAVAVFENTSEGSDNLNYTWDFGDGSTSTDKLPVHIYSTSGNYNVVLTVRTASGCSDTATLPLTVHIPASSFSYSKTLCLNQTVHFTNTSVPAPVSCTWYFGDGTTSKQLNPDKAYNKTGNYMVKVVNMFSEGCSDSVSNDISISTGPTAFFTADDTSNCIAPLSVNFTNKTTGIATEYLWDFGDGDTSSQLNPNHVYKKQGNFTVTLTAINSNGCSNVYEKNKAIVIQPLKITGLKNLPDSGCVPVIIKPTVQLNQNANIKKYSWDFGDGSTSTDPSPTHTYTKDGFFSVEVTVETEEGCSDTYTLPNGVLAGHKPKANFSAAFDSICANETQEYQNTSTNGPITFLQWDFGAILDSATGQTYYVNPPDTGYHLITLVAFNYGCSDTTFKDRIVYAKPPIARIDFHNNCDNKLMVSFADSSLLDVMHTWDFGDGTTDNSKNPDHIYKAPGDYTVSLFTTNKTCRDSSTAHVRVINETGAITLSNKIFCRGNDYDVDIAGINVDNIKNTTWDFGDGTVITVNSATKATHAYTAAGRFKIKATMIDRNNCHSDYEIPDSITVYGPLAAFNGSAPGICLGSAVSFTDKSTSDGIHNITKWSWNFGEGADENYNSSSTFTHTYKDTGYKTVRLSVTDSYGCTDSARKPDYVFVSKPFASYIISDSIACPGKLISFQNKSDGEDLDYKWDFDDGSVSNQKNPSYNYKKGGTYNPVLFVTDVNGCRDSFQNSLKVSLPAATFSVSDSVSTCPPLDVKFTNKSTDFTSVTWSFGDGSPSIIISPTHIYTYPGTYPVQLIVKGYGNCADTSSIKNILIKGPTGTMQYDIEPVCYPAKTKFTANAKNVAIYTWDFSDGNTASTTNDKISYEYQPGNYVPKLILQDAAGCKTSIKGIDTVKIFTVTANANFSSTVTCNLNPVQFTDASTSADNIIHHYWYFGDDSMVDAKMVTHYYKKEGDYDAYLIAETKLGCRDTFSIPAGVHILPKPKINIAGDSSACAMATVNYKASNAAKDSTIVWNWNFGNGKTSAGQNVSTAYNKDGNYIINLIATNSGGCADTTTTNVTVHALPNVKAGNDTTVCKGGNFQLTAKGAAKYIWSGNGLSCTNCDAPTINPTVQSTYFVTGKDVYGCAGSDSVSINIIAPGKISVAAGDTLCVGESVKLNASGAASYQWYPSIYLDNDKAAQPVFTAAKDTSITYKVIGHTAQNCFADTGYVSLKTFPVPKINIEKDAINLSAGSSVQLHSNGSADINSWRWQPPQGLSSTVVADPVASPIQSTTYACIASNGGACVARDEITINVVCGSTNVFIPNTFSPNNDGMNDIFYPRGNGLFKIKSFKVFNRWGQIVFDRSNTSPNNAADGWNGKYNGKPANTDVYVYIIEVLCSNNSVIPFKGNITLIK